MSKLSNLSIVIVTFLTDKKTLINCLNSIDKKVQIIIVENSSKFKNKDFFLNKFSNLKIYCSGKNLGYGGGNNFGLKKVKTQFALILNPDTVLDKYFFSNIKLILKNRSFALIGCELIKNKGFATGGFFNSKKNDEFKKNFSLIPRDNLTKVDWITGSSMLLNFKNLKDKKIFDENFFLYYEEFDFCKSLSNQNKKVFLSKKLRIHHLGFKSSKLDIYNFNLEAEKLRNWHWMWSLFYFYKKNYNYIYAIYKTIDKLFKSFFKIVFYLLIFDKKNFYKYMFRLLGLLTSMLGIKSFYRGKYFY